jgi:hypothetical protein
MGCHLETAGGCILRIEPAGHRMTLLGWWWQLYSTPMRPTTRSNETESGSNIEADQADSKPAESAIAAFAGSKSPESIDRVLRQCNSAGIGRPIARHAVCPTCGSMHLNQFRCSPVFRLPLA